MSNRLKYESSPYLLQHSENPVDWYPWNEEAFLRAKEEDKPVFLSIGYSTCHWCHVMEHESFENEEIANILNQYFISVKVDREERPDIDSVYMSVCQAYTGGGGWPMSIFMTPKQKPFFAGTYFPPLSRHGMPGFPELLLAIAEKWEKHREELLQSADVVLTHIRSGRREAARRIRENLPDTAVRQFTQSFDRRYGGFGQAPKFPTPHNLLFLTLYGKLKKDAAVFDMVELTLKQMRRGGIFDHIGYGFSRYSTDAYYLVPHFEKMLYDNALLILAYSAAYKASGEKMYLDTAEKTAEYILREMTGSEGEFYSAQDADSEGEEGKYYVFGYGEVCQVLGKEAGRRFCDCFGMTEQGNFEGKNIPNLLNGNVFPEKWESERLAMYDYRRRRGKLHLDDKILTVWNALMICAMSVLYRATGKEMYLSAAERACQFIEDYLLEDNILYVSCRNKKRGVKGFLDDYAGFGAAMLCLYEATAKTSYLKRAEQMYLFARRQFADEKNGGYFLYGAENKTLIIKPKESYDGALPSGNSLMAYFLVRLSQITGEEEIRQAAEDQLAFLSGEAADYPAGHSIFLLALLMYQNPPEKITVVLAEKEQKKDVFVKIPLYAEVKILDREQDGYRRIHGRTTYYVCKNHTCFPPTDYIEHFE